MKEKLCLVTGVGEGTGAAIVRRFASDGYTVAMLSRDQERLRTYESEHPQAVAFPCDLEDLQALGQTIEQVQVELGNPTVIIHNAVRATFDRLLDSDPSELERNFRVNTTSLLYLAKAFVPTMLEQGSGSIIATGNTAAFRGVPTYALFAPTKAAQRIFLESLARDFGPQGIHVAYVNIDAVIDVPWTRDRFASDKPDEFFITPHSIADEVFHIAHQPRDAWSFNVELRPYAERW
ncbi:SDR family NAD(P)-dependent oxidoreductase [Acaryochloris sp. IP29b_bin.137]|uniref:SDR family NAD(P)-dependent oxidoreductase n=1 Tax=Acaryochloris sp. IP29b_bin.137 TaxID=2969217 RepID=UPI002604C647|nr:SDR family NAD(P)-dependent oxidoreductase [Acaryochloris sp. IP29b_bin.137]